MVYTVKFRSRYGITKRMKQHRSSKVWLFVLFALAMQGTSAQLQAKDLAWQSSLAEVKELAQQGVLQLASQIVEQQQPRFLSVPAEWVQWERLRIDLYQQQHIWSAISERLKTLPDFVDLSFIQWAKTQRAIALIEQNKNDEARAELRFLIWKTQVAVTDITLLKQWRKLIIQSYLGDGKAQDAQLASHRLQQDPAEDLLEDVLLRARIAILNQRNDEAEQLLKPFARQQQPQAAALMLLAQLRAHTRSANAVLQAALRYVQNDKIQDDLKVNLWLVAAEAARQSNHHAAQVNALEHVMVDRQHVRLADSLVAFNSDSLWNAYIEYALLLSNKEQLLIGQDKAWLETAEKRAAKSPTEARAMNAFIMLRGNHQTVQQQAAEAFVASILQRRQGKALLLNLFKDSKYFKKLSDIPVSIRHALVDIALASSDIDRASEIMATITAPLSQQGQDQFMWRLRRARILVLGNQAEAGVTALSEIIAQHTQLTTLQRDRLLQVIFDLQTAGQHPQAYRLFESLLPQTTDTQPRRELFYWMADSQKAMEAYREAAELYLKSAFYPDPTQLDPWGQTAVYQAAEVLTRGGLYHDAEHLFERLLRTTEDPARRATLKRELQRLWALQ